MTKYPNTLIYFESTRNSFLEGKILGGIQFMIWCWEVIRRFLSLKIPAPKLKRPQCMAPPRRGPGLTFSNSYWAHSLFCKTLQGRLLGIGMSHNCMDSYLSVNCFLFRRQSSVKNLTLGQYLQMFFLAASNHQLCAWPTVMSYYHFLSSKPQFLVTLKWKRHFETLTPFSQ